MKLEEEHRGGDKAGAICGSDTMHITVRKPQPQSPWHRPLNLASAADYMGWQGGPERMPGGFISENKSASHAPC